MIGTKWKIEVNMLMNEVHLTGAILTSSCTERTFRTLLTNANKIMSIAEKNRGIFNSLVNPPARKDKQFVYFEVRFENAKDCINFLNAILDKSS